MSRSVNSITLLGHAGNDPEVRSTRGGTAVATFSLATNTGWKDEQGETQERVQWHRVVAWEALAEIAGKYVTKGKQLYIRGRVDYRSWEDKDGQTRYSTEIVAQEIVLLGGGADERNERRAEDSPEAARAAQRNKTAAAGGERDAAPQAEFPAPSGKQADKGKGKGSKPVPF